MKTEKPQSWGIIKEKLFYFLRKIFIGCKKNFERWKRNYIVVDSYLYNLLTSFIVIFYFKHLHLTTFLIFQIIFLTLLKL